jgi:hypothetical protein
MQNKKHSGHEIPFQNHTVQTGGCAAHVLHIKMLRCRLGDVYSAGMSNLARHVCLNLCSALLTELILAHEGRIVVPIASFTWLQTAL